MLIVLKDVDSVHIFKTRSYQNTLYRDSNDLLHPDNQSLVSIGDHTVLGVNVKQKLIDFIIPHIYKDHKLQYDTFIDLDYKQIKKSLQNEGLLNIHDMKSKAYDTEVVVYAKNNDYVVIEGFEKVLASKPIYVSSQFTKMVTYLLYYENLNPKDRVIKTLLDDMEHVYYNYFPLQYINTKDQRIEVITLKEALCR